MTDPLLVLGVAVLLIALLVARVPVAFSLLVSGVVGVYFVQDHFAAESVLARMPYDTSASYGIIIVPLFIALGVMASRGRLATDGFVFAARLTRRLPGGLAIAAVVACAAFSAVSGSSAATVVALGPTTVREMVRHGYNKVVAAGVIGAAGTLGILIPPSVALVLYGILTRESIGDLLLAGIMPGLVSALVFAVAIMIRAKLQPDLFGREPVLAASEPVLVATGSRSPSTRLPTQESPAAEISAAGNGSSDGVPSAGFGEYRVSSIVRLGILFGVIMGGIYLGVATETEAAALGALLALVFYCSDALHLPKGTRWQDARETFAESTRLTGMTMALLIGGAVFSYFLVIAGVPAAFGEWVTGISASPLVVAILVVILFLILGMFIDGLSILLIAVPLTYPVMTGLGYDGIWFGIVVVKAIEIGLITPPFGLNAYMVAGTTPGLSVREAFRGVMWFVPLELLLIVLLFLVPDLATWLPSVAGN
ncbi:TRAP transporter large permease subunit [Nocardioides sp.]|uniref:TRAP transporter large permease n=1 Tax=Nocardioides sp. TaxID=35761 RepID=UPI00321ADED3